MFSDWIFLDLHLTASPGPDKRRKSQNSLERCSVQKDKESVQKFKNAKYGLCQVFKEGILYKSQ